MTEEAIMKQEASPFFTVLQAIVEKNYEPSFIEKMMELAERNEAREARRAYHEAMALFKENAPAIIKDKKVSYGNTSYKHASLSNVVKTLTAELSKYGFSVSWEPLQTEKQIKVTCKITHKMGHFESTTIEAPPDTSGSKNSIQAIGSTISYLERYTLLALLGMATDDMDDDGRNAEVKFITDKEAEAISKTIADRNIDKEKFLKYMGVESVDKIIAKDLSKATTALKAAKGRTQNDN